MKKLGGGGLTREWNSNGEEPRRTALAATRTAGSPAVSTRGSGVEREQHGEMPFR